jgi:ABC-type transport system involved in multi-copper enzyme maturation permease subunit
MTFLPIVERELRERARWRSTYWVRGVVAFFATGIAAFVLIFVPAAAPGAVGRVTLAILAWLALPFVVLEGLRNTADSLSQEKREGTLGLLFLTDLHGYDVVLGKFVASSLTSFYALLALIPALAIPVLLGGVTGAEFWRLVLALVNALFFSLTAGTFVSSISRDERKAWSGTFALVGFFFVAIPPLAVALNSGVSLTVWSPFLPFWLYSANGYSSNPPAYWQSLCITNALGWLWLALASFLLPRLWQESGSPRMRRRAAPESPRHRRRRAEMLALNPICWLTSRHVHQRAWLWVIVCLASAAGVLGFIAAQGNAAVLWSVFGAALLLHFALAIWVASEACHSFAEARSTGAMEILLSTPLPVRQILRGQHLALRELFLGPIVLLVAVELCLVAAQISMWAAHNSGGAVLLVLVLGFTLVWFVLDLFAVAEVGMWYGLTSQKPTQALTKTVVFVLVLPLLLVAAPCCWGIGPGLMVAKSVIFFTWAQSKLEKQFRRAATERYDLPRVTSWLRRTPPRLRMPGERRGENYELLK